MISVCAQSWTAQMFLFWECEKNLTCKNFCVFFCALLSTFSFLLLLKEVFIYLKIRHQLSSTISFSPLPPPHAFIVVCIHITRHCLGNLVIALSGKRMSIFIQDTDSLCTEWLYFTRNCYGNTCFIHSVYHFRQTEAHFVMPRVCHLFCFSA